MGEASGGLRRLRPVTFYYKQAPYRDGPGQAQQGGPRQLQYGLIAEEVAAVYPELVEYSDTGEPFGVRYHLLGAMLLNELHRQDRQIQGQATQIAALEAQLQALNELEKKSVELDTKTKELDVKTKLIDELSQRIEALERLVKVTQTARSEATE